MTTSAKLNENTPLSVLVRRLDEIICGHTRNALQLTLDEGDALAWAKDRVPGRPIDSASTKRSIPWLMT